MHAASHEAGRALFQCRAQSTETMSKYLLKEVVIFFFKQNSNKDLDAMSVPYDVQTSVRGV